MKFLHTMVRISDIDKSLDFYCNKLGLKEVRRIENASGKFTLIFLSDPEESGGGQIELTYNWEKEEYDSGRNFGHLAFSVEDIYTTCKRLLDLGVTIAKANQDQTNAMERFNVGEENVMAQFNEEEKRKREEFNVENRRLIEQTNATYKQQVTTDETAAINAAYEIEAKAANTLSKEAYNNLVNEEKDMMYYAFTGEQNELDRVNKLSTANINSGSGGALEKGFADMASEVVTSWITSKFPAK